MKLPHYTCLVLLALAAPSSSPATEITGKVRDTSGETASVAIDGDTLPAVGDGVEIFFKLAGAGEDILVASGKVAAVEAKLAKVTIESATGTVAKDQSVRIKPASVTKAPGPSTSSASSPSEATAAAGPSIVGHWAGTYRDGPKYFYTFNADQTFTWTIDEKRAGSDARTQMTVKGRYRLDNTTKPNRMEMFDFDHPDVPRDKRQSAPFEFQGDSQFKMDLSVGASENPEKGFTDSATIFSKVTSPPVAPPEK